jgi:hypothetical protein
MGEIFMAGTVPIRREHGLLCDRSRGTTPGRLLRRILCEIHVDVGNRCSRLRGTFRAMPEHVLCTVPGKRPAKRRTPRFDSTFQMKSDAQST